MGLALRASTTVPCARGGPAAPALSTAGAPRTSRRAVRKDIYAESFTVPCLGAPASPCSVAVSLTPSEKAVALEG